MANTVKPDRIVRVPKGQTVHVHAGKVVIDVTRYTSGAVELQNGSNGSTLRQWNPKEAKDA